ncbi:hypothetical protein D3C75_135580 [compost metagenome]
MSGGWTKWQNAQYRRDNVDTMLKQKARGEKALTSHERVKQSILDMRKIYTDKDDLAFAKWYGAKYRIKADAVLKVIQGGDQNGS